MLPCAAVPADAQPLRVEWQVAENKTEALELAVGREGDELLLYRRDVPLRYRFSANQGKRLLELEQPAPEPSQPGQPGTDPAPEAPAAPPPATP